MPGTQVILNARLTRFYEREDWKRRLRGAGDDALLLERGIERVRRTPAAELEDPVTTEDEEQPSTIEIAARQLLAETDTSDDTKLKQGRLL